jgi:hypothetical protein
LNFDLWPPETSFLIIFKKQNFSTESHRIIISLHFLHFSSHLTRNIQNIALFP